MSQLTCLLSIASVKDVRALKPARSMAPKATNLSNGRRCGGYKKEKSRERMVWWGK